MADSTTATKREGSAAAAKTPPPPVIGKAGRYTVFITPPATPKPQQKPAESPKTPATPPVQAPPQQFQKPSSTAGRSSAGFGFFWNAIAKVQEVHSTVDEYLADLLGLDQSKYQWALNDYYETKGMIGIFRELCCSTQSHPWQEKDVAKPKDQSGKGMSV